MTPQRFNSVAIILHWGMALAFIAMLASGLIMTDLEDGKQLQFQLYQWHKSLGVILLCLVAIRIVVRLISTTPDLPRSMPRLEKIAAKFGHLALYAMMIAMPISGWAMVSASVYGLPTIVFGLFEWPHIPNIAANKEIESLAKEFHEIAALIFIGIIGLHILAVIKHYFFDKMNLLNRMWWR